MFQRPHMSVYFAETTAQAASRMKPRKILRLKSTKATKDQSKCIAKRQHCGRAGAWSQPKRTCLVKGTKFLELRDAGDPVECALAYNDQGADELVFLDIYVDPREHVYPMQVPLGSMRDMLLTKTERT